METAGPSTMERDVPDLLTPDGVRELLKELKGLAYMDKLATDLEHLCRNYITLWDERDKAVKRVTQLKQEIGALTR